MTDRDQARWGSDVLAEVLCDLDVPYVANVPGSSYRGLHDSIVNHLGNRPELVLALHEETAVAAGYRPCGHCLRARYRERLAG